MTEPEEYKERRDNALEAVNKYGTDRRIFGTVCLNTHVLLGVTKKGVSIRQFNPSDPDLPPFKVTCKREFQSVDVYATIRYTEWPEDSVYPIGTIESIVGDVGNPEVEYEAVLYRNSIKYKRDRLIEFADEELGSSIDKIIVSIDPKGCEDIDDALHVVQLAENRYEVGVHIADVSHFVTPDSDLDKRAKERMETVYLGNRNIEMLPEKLSCDLCSLKQGVNRRAVSVIFTINTENWTVMDYSIRCQIVRVTKNLSYEKADRVRTSQNSLVGLSVQKLYWIAENLMPSDCFDIKKMVEVFMVLSNKTVAQHLVDKYGVENVPLRKHSGDYTSFRDSEADPEAVRMAEIMRLDRAEYQMGSPGGNNRHNLLNLDYYVHFTSPIRRYMDLIIHRMLFSNTESGGEQLCSAINIKKQEIKRACREKELLDFAFSGQITDDNCVFPGYTVGFRDNKATIYVPAFGLTVDCSVYSNRIEHLVDSEVTDNSIKVTINDKTLQLNLLQQVYIQIVVLVTSSRFKDKVRLQMVEPDPIEILNLSSDN